MQTTSGRVTLTFVVATACSVAACDQPDTRSPATGTAGPSSVDEPTAAPGTNAEALWSRVRSAEQHLNDGQYERASREIDAVLDELRAAGDTERALLAAAHHVRGRCRMELGNLTEAVSDLERARQLHRSGDDEEEYSRSTAELAAVYDHLERYPEAERLFRELVERTRTVHGASSPEHGRALCDLGISLEFQGRCADAVPLLEQATRILSGAVPETTALDSAWNALGNCAYQAGQRDTALGHYERSLELRTRAIGAEHPRTAVVRHNLARVLMELGRRREALAHARAAVVIRQRELPADHPWRRETEGLYVELGGRVAVEPH